MEKVDFYLRLRTFSTLCIATLTLTLLGSEPPNQRNLGIIAVTTEADAQIVLRQLQSGLDFVIVAKEKSIDVTAADGGYMGNLDPAQLRPEIQQALKGLKAGQFTNIVHIPQGFAILTVFASPPRTHDLNADRIKSLFSAGTVRDTIDISGQASANAALQAFSKPEGWNRDFNQVCAVRTNSYSAAVERIGKQLPQAEAQPPGKVPPLSLLQGHAVLALLFIYTGEMEKSLVEWDKAYRIALTSVPGSVPYVQEALGVTYLHLAEMENSIYRHPGDRGIFPRPVSAGS